MANPNIVSTSLIFGKTDVLMVGTAASSITSNQANSGKVLKVNSLVVSNTNGSSSVDINVSLMRSTTDYFIAKTVSVPPDASLVVIGKENPMYLNEGDALRLVAGSSDAAHAVCSYEEIG